MKLEQGTFEPAGTLPLVPAAEDDELISSWLARTAQFYGRPLRALLADGSRQPSPIDLAGIDLGVTRHALTPVARLLGLDLDLLSQHTIAAGYPWAMNLVAQTASLPGAERPPRLRYAACSHCLEQQRAERGFSWLRREWIFAPRTVCKSHGVLLSEVDAGAVAHPTWVGFLRRHGGSAQTLHEAASGGLGEVELPDGPPPSSGLLCRIAALQTAMLALRAGGPTGDEPDTLGQMATVLSDLVWAFTRRDAIHGDRLVYEAFASDRLNSAWQIARHRRADPVEFRRLHLDERHRMLVTAVVLMGPTALRDAFYSGPCTTHPNVDALDGRLGPSDRKEFAARRAKWPPKGLASSITAAESTI